MNKCYRIVWSRVLGLWVVVSELVARKGRPVRAVIERRAMPGVAALSLVLLAPPLALAAGAAHATGTTLVAKTIAATAPANNLPTGATIVAGSASLQQRGTTLTIDQSSDKLITNWQSFDIGSGYEVDFNQPSASSVALNRVVGSDASKIFGTLHANGQVFLINQNGVLFAPGAQVDVGGLVASTLDISDSDFLAGKYAFSGTAGIIENDGTLQASAGGYVALLGGSVSNSGIVQAQLGSVALAAGSKVTLDFAGDGLLSVSIDQGVLDALVENHGAVIADGGKVLLGAKAAAELIGGVVNNDGLVQARTLQEHAGTIELLGDMDVGSVAVAGTLDASAPDGGDGGQIETSAHTVNVAADATITTLAASGNTGTWLLDPTDITIDGGEFNSPDGTEYSSGLLSQMLGTSNVTLIADNSLTVAGWAAIASSSGNALSLSAGGALSIASGASIDIAGALTLKAGGNINLAADIIKSIGLLAVTSTNGDISQQSGSGVIIASTSSFTAFGSISLPNYNSLGTVALSSGGDADIYDSYPLTLGASSIGGDLIVESQGSIAQTGVLSVAGTSNFNAGSNAITLTSTGNDFTGAVSLTASTAAITDANALVLGTATVSGNLTAASSGAITQTGVLSVAGTSNFNAGSNAITLTSTGNDFTGAVSLTASTAAITDANALVLGTATVSGNLTATSSGALTLSGDVTTGTLDLESGGAITQTGGIITVGKLTGSSDGNTMLTRNNAITMLGAFASTGDFSLTNAESLTVNDTATISGRATLTTTAGKLTIDALTAGSALLTGAAGILLNGNVTTIGAQEYASAVTLDADSTATSTGGAIAFDATIDGAHSLTVDANGDIVFGGAIGGLTALSGLTLDAGGTISDDSALSVAKFVLQGGDWEQNAATLPGFSATDFELQGGTFLRVTGGDGSSTHPYQIADVYGLQGMASTSLLADDFALANDIDAGGTANWNCDDDGCAGFVPIGTSSSAAFSGSFDGQGHAISGLTINRPTTDYVGLFGFNAGTIRDLGLEGGSVSGRYYVGGLVGFNHSSISEAYATGSVTGTNYVGGLVGYNLSGSISEAYATGSVTGSSSVGGLVGYNYSSISNAYATGSVSGTGGSDVGGLVGFNGGSISDAYATGSVTGSYYVGGLVGANEDSISASFYATTDADGNAINSGLGLVGYSTSGTVDSYSSGKTWAELTTLSTFIDAGWDDISNVGGDGSVWRIYEGSTTPLLRGFLTRVTVTADSGGSKTYDGTTDAGDVGYTPSIIGAALDGTASYTLDSKNAGTRTVSVDGLYSDQQGYDIVYAGGSYTVGKATLTLSAGTDSKVYDGTTTSAGTVDVVGLQTGDSLNALTQSFASKNVLGADASTLQVDAGYGIDDGNGGANYTVVTDTASGTITPLAIDGVIAAANKTYDGTTSATTSGTLSGVISGDDVAFETSGAFADKDAGTDKTVDVSGGLDGTDAGNYALSTNTTTTADIAKAVLTVTGNDASKAYDGKAYEGGNGVTYSGFVDGETSDVLGGTLVHGGSAQGATQMGRYDIEPSGLTSVDYDIRYVDGVLTIYSLVPSAWSDTVAALQSSRSVQSVPAGSPQVLQVVDGGVNVGLAEGDSPAAPAWVRTPQ